MCEEIFRKLIRIINNDSKLKFIFKEWIYFLLNRFYISIIYMFISFSILSKLVGVEII